MTGWNVPGNMRKRNGSIKSKNGSIFPLSTALRHTTVSCYTHTTCPVICMNDTTGSYANERVARLQCLHPKEDIHPYFSYYDKQTGLSTGSDSALSKLFVAKAQITIAERKEKEYIKYPRANNLFFDEVTDKQLVLFRQRLHIKKITMWHWSIKSG